MNQTREELLFQLALSKPAAKRAAWLDAECEGDAALRVRLEALLTAHEQPETLLATHAEKARPTIKHDLADAPDEAVGQTLRRYKLLERVGEGGCGVVYVAEQTEPVRRRVALKVIKLGMDTKQLVARFEAERQALAMMDHPNIAKVLDAGTTDVGRPFFVMELVRGIKITDYCDQANLSTKERLDLFIKVCQAIQHAHQKGIIHRDIKPSNILVTLHDGVPVPKVIDFGIAKATEGRLTDSTVYTQLHQFMGTPAYMSPEQAEMSGLDIDTRSDIYSLGVLLYELLAGSTPFDAKELMSQGIDAMRKTIREKEPQRPSTKLSQTLVAADVRRLKSPATETPSSEEEVRAASRRLLRVKETITQLKGDLDWIVMKCLEKDRQRRYDTANGLAADLKRHLNNEPVVARPPSTAYRLQKAWRRNRVLFTAGATVAATLVLGIGVSSWHAVMANRAKFAAFKSQEEALRARNAEVQQREKAVKARDQAHEHELKARRNAYVATMTLAYQALDDGHLGRARELQRTATAAVSPPNPAAGAWAGTLEDIRGWEWRYLWSQTRGDDLFILGRHEPIAQVAFWLPDGARAISAGKDGRVKLWDVEKRRLLRQISLPDRVNGLAISPDGTRFVAGLGNGHVSLWNMATFQPLWQITVPHAIGHLIWSPDGEMIAAAGDDILSVLNAPEGSLLRRLENSLNSHYGWKVGLAFTVDSKSLLYGLADSSIRILDLKSGTHELFAKIDGGGVYSLAFSPDGRYLAEADFDAVHVWDWPQRIMIWTLPTPNRHIACVAFSPDGTQLATAGADQRLRLWNTTTWTETASLRGHEFELWSAAYSPDGRRLITASKDDTIRIWNQKSGVTGEALSLAGERGFATSDGGTNATLLVMGWGANASKFTLHHLLSGQTLVEGELEPRYAGGSAVALMPNHLAAFGFPDGRIDLVDLNSKQLLWTVTNHLQAVQALSGVSAGGRLAAVYADGRIDLLNFRIGVVEQVLQSAPSRDDPSGMVLELSRDGKQLLAAPQGAMEFTVWNLDSGTARRIPVSHREGVRVAVFSDDGEWIVTASYDTFASLWESKSGRELARFSGPLKGFSDAAVSPDRTRVALISHDGKLSIWDPINEQPLVSFLSAPDRDRHVRWNSGADRIATWGFGQLMIRRAPSWEEIAATEAKEKAESKQP